MKNEQIFKYIILAILIIVLGAWFINCDMPKTLTCTDLSEYAGDDKAQTPVLNLSKGHLDIILNYSSTEDSELIVYKDGHSPLFIALPSTNGEDVDYEFAADLLYGYDYFRLSVSNTSVNNMIFNSYTVKSSRPFYFDKLIILGISLVVILSWLLIAIIFDKTDKSVYRKICNKLNVDTFSILLMLIALIISSIPCFFDFLPKIKGQDLTGHLTRIEGIKSGLISGQLPVEIYSEAYWGFGIMGALYPSIFIYIPALIRLIFRTSAVFSMCIFLITVNIATVFSMYYCANVITKRNRFISTAITVLYLLAPYRINNMYVRSALGEVTAMIFTPVIVAGLYLLLCPDAEANSKKKNYFPLVIGLSCTLNCHLISIVYAAIICLILGIVYIKETFKLTTLIALIKAAVLTFLICSSFLISYVCFNMSDKLNLDGLNRRMYKTAISIGDMFNIIPQTLPDGESIATFYSLGIVGAVLFILLLFLYIHNLIIKKKVAIDNTVIFGVVSLILAFLFALLSTHYVPWKQIQDIHLFDIIISKFQFPWRFLSLSTLFMLIALAVIADKLNINKTSFEVFSKVDRICVITTVIFLASIISILPLFNSLLNVDEKITKVSGAITEGRIDEYLPYTKEIDQTWAGRSYATLSDYDAIHADNYNKVYSTISFEYSADKNDLYVDLPLTYYSDYKAYEIDASGNKIDLRTEIGKYEALRVYINKHEEVRPVLIYYKIPLHAYIGIAISIIGCILFVICLISFRRQFPEGNS